MTYSKQQVPFRLVSRGDDAGMCHTVNIAIRDACAQGLVRNVSVMVPAPAFDEAAEIFRDLQGVALGLHVDLTAEWAHLRWGPVLSPDEVPTLVDNAGHFFHTGQSLYANAPRLEHMQREVRAQLEKARAAGLDIAYLDEHMGVGWINGLANWLHDFCEHEGLICNRALLDQGRLKRLPQMPPGTDPVHTLIAQLGAAAPATYLLVGHPVYKTPEMLAAHMPEEAPGVQANARDWQRRMFMDAEILDYTRSHAIQAIRYTDI